MMNKAIRITLIAALCAALAVTAILLIHAKKLRDEPPPEIPADITLIEEPTEEQTESAPTQSATEQITEPTAPATDAPVTEPITEPQTEATAVPTEYVPSTPQVTGGIDVSLDLPPYAGYSFDESSTALLRECAFVGDSICSGLYVYGVLPRDIVVATGNVGIRSLHDYSFEVAGGSYSAIEALRVINPKYVIFSMGMNDINVTSAETYCENYLGVLAETRAVLPGAKLYVASITPISSSSNFASNDKINSYNAAVKNAVESAGYGYIDVATHLRDATGGLGSGFNGGDGIHINKAAYYSILTDVVNRVS